MFGYGSDAYRTLTTRNRYLITPDGRTVLALADQLGGPPLLHAVAVRGGAVSVGPEVTAFALAGAGVVAAPVAQPAALTLLRRDDLRPVATIDLGAPPGARVVAVAAAATAVAAALDDPPTLVVAGQDGERPRQVALPARPTALALTADGAVAAVGTGQQHTGGVVLVDLAAAAMTHVLKGPRAPIGSLVLAPAGDLVAAAAGQRVLCWALAADRASRAVTLHATRGDAEVYGITAGGLVVAGTAKGPLVAADPVTATTVWAVPHHGPACVDGQRVLSARFDQLRELDAGTGEVRHVWDAPDHVQRVAAAGGPVVAGLGGSRLTALRGPGRWPAPPAGHDQVVRAVSFDGARFATSGRDARVFVWRRGSAIPERLVEPEHRRSHIDGGGAVHLDGGRVHTVFRQQVQRWSLADGVVTASSEPLRTDIVALVPAPALGVLVAVTKVSGGTAGELAVLAGPDLAPVHRRRLPWTYPVVRLVGQDRLLLDHPRHAMLFDLDTHAVLEERHHPPAGGDGQWITGPGGEPVVMIAYRGGGRAGPPLAAFTHIDPATGEAGFPPVPLPRLTGAAALSAGGLLATPHTDAIRVWHAATGRPVTELPAPPRLDALWFFPDGRALLATCRNGAVFEVGPVA